MHSHQFVEKLLTDIFVAESDTSAQIINLSLMLRFTEQLRVRKDYVIVIQKQK